MALSSFVLFVYNVYVPNSSVVRLTKNNGCNTSIVVIITASEMIIYGIYTPFH
jgi:hypothetical protein